VVLTDDARRHIVRRHPILDGRAAHRRRQCAPPTGGGMGARASPAACAARCWPWPLVSW